MNSPHFLIVGVHKCGTTSIFDSLCSHPGIHGSLTKEPHYFSSKEVSNTISDVVKEKPAYEKLFSNANDLLCGEASITYAYFHESASNRILNELGEDVKIVFCVRNPVERAFSAYLDVKRNNELERLDFLSALKAEDKRASSGTFPPTMFYKSMGMYHQMISTYRKKFKDVHVFVLDDPDKPSDRSLSELQEFLGVDSLVPLELGMSNAGGTEWKNSLVELLVKAVAPRERRQDIRNRFPFAYEKVRRLFKSNLYKKASQMDQDARKYLTDYYKPHIPEMERTIGRKLGFWIQSDDSESA